jgi:hypothetical protein
MHRIAAPITIAALFLLPTVTSAHETSRGRLVFAEHDTPFVRVLDLDSGKVTHSFKMPKPRPSLAAGGRYVVILTGDDKGTVRVLDTGVVLDSHGDHQDIEKRDVRLLKVTVTGERPSHVMTGDGWTSIFYDGPRPGGSQGEAKAVLLNHRYLVRDRTTTLTWTSPGPQHGAAAPLGGDLWALTSPNPAYARQEPDVSSLPTGIQVIDAGNRWAKIAAFDGSADPAVSCAELHGHGTDGKRHVFGCKEGGADSGPGTGLLVLERDAGGAWKACKLAYSDDRRASTIKSREGVALMVANYGKGRRYDALLGIAPDKTSLSADDVFTIPDGQTACQFDVSGDGQVVNLLPDGTLRVYAVSPAWKEVARVDAVAPFDCSFGAASPRPALELAGGRVFVSDPVKRRIRAFDAKSLKTDRDFAVNGAAEALAAGPSAE